MAITKLKDLKDGMKNVEIEAKIDFVGEGASGGYGEEPYKPVFLKDETGEIRMVMFGYELVKKAKPGKKVSLKKGYVTSYKGSIQLNSQRTSPPVIK